jgi:hypothetical protein
MKIVLLGMNRDNFDAHKNEYGNKNWAIVIAQHIYFRVANKSYGDSAFEVKLKIIDMDDDYTDGRILDYIMEYDYHLCLLTEDEYNSIAFKLWQFQKATIESKLMELWADAKGKDSPIDAFYVIDTLNQMIHLDIYI